MLELECDEGKPPFLSLRRRIAVAIVLLSIFSLYVGFTTAPLLVATISTQVEIPSSDEGPGDQAPKGGEEVTLFRENFSSLDAQWIELEKGTGTVNLRGGSALLNLTKESSDHTQSVAELSDLHGMAYRWLYVATEIRLRCRTDNALEGETRGGGAFSWGIGDNYPGFPWNALFFLFSSPQSIQSPGRFDAIVIVNDAIVSIEPLIGIDPTQWHNYTIQWEPGNATFLVDGKVVAFTQKVPVVPMAIGIRLTNDAQYVMEPGRRPETTGHLDLAHDVGIQVERVKMFMNRPQYARYVEEVNHTLLAAQEKVQDAERNGMNTTRMRDDMAAATQAFNEGQYVPANLYVKLVTLAQLSSQDLLELSNLFPQAYERIQSLRSQGEDTRMLEGRFAQAELAWNLYEFTLAGNHLHKILEDEKT
jgi:hypothetical protein